MRGAVASCAGLKRLVRGKGRKSGRGKRERKQEEVVVEMTLWLGMEGRRVEGERRVAEVV